MHLFEYSTLPWDHVAAFAIIVEDIFHRYSIEAIRDEVFRLQDLFLAHLDRERYRPLCFDALHRSGILSIDVEREAGALVKQLARRNVIVTERAGYVRVAPHFYLDDEQVITAAHCFNELAARR